MQKELLLKLTRRRRNLFRENFFAIFFGIASYPMLLLDVFVHRNMGRRHFSLTNSIVMAIVLAMVPMYYASNRHIPWHFIVTMHFSWYVFLAAFLWFALRRYKEIRLGPSVFDMTRMTTSEGDIIPFFLNLKWKGEPISVRILDIYVVPFPFFAIGFLLLPIGQVDTGLLLMGCSVLYFLSNSATWIEGDNILMDLIDNWLAEQTFATVFVDDTPSTTGVNLRATKPQSRKLRQAIADELLKDDEPAKSVF